MPNTQNNQPDIQPAAVLGFPTNIPQRDEKQGLKGFADLTPDQAKASLGIATHLMSQLMPQAPQDASKQASQTQNSAPQEAEKPQEANDSPKEEKAEFHQIQGEFKQFKEDISKTIDDKIGQLTDMIKQALQDDGEQG